MALGDGSRFAALKAKLAGRPGVSDPSALAATIGRKKYGAKKMSALARAKQRLRGGESTPDREAGEMY